jgi:LacI family transcriptional regulator
MARTERPSDHATIIDVAREAGVSYATVSRVINNKAHVKPEKREAVLDAMRRLGYVVNRRARSLASGRSLVIGLLVQSLDSSWMGAVLRGIDEELEAAGYELMLYTTHRRRHREAVLVEAITSGMTDGLLLLIPQDPAAYLATLRAQRFPFVLVDHLGVDEEGPSVQVTNSSGARAAVEYLAGLGHRRVGFITGVLAMPSARARLAAFEETAAALGLDQDGELVAEGDFGFTSGYEAADRLLSLPDRPTAIFASNDVMALAVMSVAGHRGLRVPEDLSVIGFDDIAESATAHPPLTTIRQPLEQMGRSAARLLLQQIEAPELPPERVILPTELVVRGSCQPPAAHPGAPHTPSEHPAR